MTLQTLPATCGWRLFKIQGQLDFAAAPAVQAALLHAAEIEHSDLLIDLEDIEIADEKGVGTLKSVVRRLLNDYPGLQISIIAKHAWLADMLTDDYPAHVVIFRSGAEALDSIQLRKAA